MKYKILIIALILGISIVGIGAYKKIHTKQEPKQSAQELRMQRDITEIRKFSGSPDLAVQYESESKSSYNEKVSVGVYTAGSDQYEVDARTGDIIQFGPSPTVSGVGDGTVRPREDSKILSPEELELKAREFISSHTKNVQLDKLTPSHGNKEANYFFRWEDRSQKTTEGYPFVQVGLSQGGVLISYTNALL